MDRSTPGASHGTGDLSATATKSSPHLGWGRRHSRLLRARWDSRTPSDGGHHWWRIHPLSSTYRAYREAGRRAGHSADKLSVGLHAIGFLGDTSEQAAEDFYPGYAHTFTEIGKERGWPPATRAQFDALRGPKGALLIGDARTVAQKVLYANEALGGLSRITFQMGVSALPHQKMLSSIELLGSHVAPLVRKELTTVSEVVA